MPQERSCVRLLAQAVRGSALLGLKPSALASGLKTFSPALKVSSGLLEK
ncbi:hypothetical protein [Pelagicoccus sp. SDUM812003]|nr:hypothetical protein [Pelagicoccus sp. SDUM812003]MDQ8205514.1 hypothetical protein [Pelagicoccus sp. SDUM812003]